MTNYFAYGSNMDPDQMVSRCPGARALGAARLCDHRLAFVWDSPGWGGGVGTVVRAPGGEVWGVLWDLTPEHEAALDGYEGVAQGVYARETIRVEHERGSADALVYVAASDRAKPPSRRYLDALVRGAEAHGLPRAYVTYLRSFAA